MNINGLGSPIPLSPSSFGSIGGVQNTPTDAASFKNLLLNSINEVNGMQQDAQFAVENLVTGGEVNMAEVMSTVQKADMSFRLMVQMRNKLVQAYEEIKDVRI